MNKIDNGFLEETAASGVVFASNLKRDILLLEDTIKMMEDMLKQAEGFITDQTMAIGAAKAHIENMQVMVKATEQAFPVGNNYAPSKEVKRIEEVAKNLKPNDAV